LPAADEEISANELTQEEDKVLRTEKKPTAA